MFREPQVPVKRGIGHDVVADEVEDVHRRSRVVRRNSGGAKQGGQIVAGNPVFVESVPRPVQGTQHGKVIRVRHLREAPERAHRVGEVARFAAAVGPLEDDVPVGEAVEKKQRLGVLDRSLYDRPAYELVYPPPMRRDIGDQIDAPAGHFLDGELLKFQIFGVGKRNIDPEALDDVVLREVPTGLAGFPGKGGGEAIVRIGQSRAAIDAAGKLVEDDQLRQKTLRRVPDRIAEEAIQPIAVHLLAPVTLDLKNAGVFDASGKRAHPPFQHPLLPILARSVSRASQATEPEIQYRLR